VCLRGQVDRDEILCLEQQLAVVMQPHQLAIDRLCTIPGVNVITAWTLIFELDQI
jgi:hypothetical protein